MLHTTLFKNITENLKYHRKESKDWSVDEVISVLNIYQNETSSSAAVLEHVWYVRYSRVETHKRVCLQMDLTALGKKLLLSQAV